MGQFIKVREYPDASFRDVTAPNADTLYTTALFDVGKEPWVFSIPDMKGRYSLFPMLDGWTTVFQVPGKRTTGTRRPDLCHHRTRLEGHAARRREGVQVADQHRLAAGPHLLHRHAGGLRGRPCAPGPVSSWCRSSAYGKPLRRPPARSIPSIDMKTAVRDQVNAHRCGGLLHPAGRADEDAIRRSAADAAARRAASPSIGAGSGQGLRRKQAQRRLRQAHPAGRGVRPHHAAVQDQASAVKDINGWRYDQR